METITIDKDIIVFFVTAPSFPDGVQEAHAKLHSMIPFSIERKYFGISRPENGNIVYKAATEELYPGEASKYTSETIVLKKGQYICQTIKDYMNDIQSIGRSFTELLKQPDLDPQGYCIEWYINDTDVKCMIRKDKKYNL